MILAPSIALAAGVLNAGLIFVPNPIVLTPGTALRIPFTVNPATWGGMPSDLLELSLAGDGTFSPPAPQSSVINRLYDGETLLGVYSIPIATVLDTFTGRSFGGRWKSPTSISVWPWTVVDFSSILDGTIDGHIDVLVLSGSLTLDTSSYGPSLYLLRSDSQGGQAVAGLGYPSDNLSWFRLPNLVPFRCPLSACCLSGGCCRSCAPPRFVEMAGTESEPDRNSSPSANLGCFRSYFTHCSASLRSGLYSN